MSGVGKYWRAAVVVIYHEMLFASHAQVRKKAPLLYQSAHGENLRTCAQTHRQAEKFPLEFTERHIKPGGGGVIDGSK